MPFQEVLPAVRAGGADLDAGRLGRDRGTVGSAPCEGAGRGSKLQWHRDRQWQWWRRHRRRWQPARPPPGPPPWQRQWLETAPALITSGQLLDFWNYFGPEPTVTVRARRL